MKLALSLLSLALSTGFAMSAANAEELTGTLKKIKDNGAIVLAYRDTAIPFSYVGIGQKPMGYSWDIALAIAEEVKKELGMPDLQIRSNLVTAQTRIPLLQNGTVDLECGATTNNSERRMQVDFSTDIFAVGIRLLTRKSSGVIDYPDLAGKNVVTAAGSTSERLIKALNADKDMRMNVISAKDIGEAFIMVESNRASALMIDDVLQAGLRTRAKQPDDWIITGTPISFENYGCMLRKDDPRFKRVVDRTIKELYSTKAIEPLYAKWFTSPIPPKSMNLNFPMNDALKVLYSTNQ
ncbi:transporter substrate-binding domain-containing protein [Pseudomonas sp. NPDC089422]|uniref:transporter substrate-binding domain-containing protein n=1 Tax=Pseudomonas sp. NPDC089422 TaxID=3364466 RepID=UPI0037F24185